MANALIISGSGASSTVAAGSTRYTEIAGSPGLTTNEANVEFTTRNAGTFSLLYIQVSANATTATSTINFRKNKANGNQSISISAGATGDFEDASNTDTVATGDEVNYRLVAGSGGTLSFTNLACIYAAGTKTANFLAFSFSLSTASQTEYSNLGQSTFDSGTTEANAQAYIHTAVDSKKFLVNVGSNGRSTTTTFRSRKNGANGNATISVTGSSTGIFEDTVNTDSLVANDKYCMSATTGTGTGVLSCSGKTNFITTDECALYITASSGRVYTAGNTSYLNICGRTDLSSTESFSQIQARHAFTATRVAAYVSSNGVTNTTTLVTRKNGVDGNISVSITGSTTGWFEDTTNTDDFTKTDQVNYKMSSSAGGTSLTLQSVQMTKEETAVSYDLVAAQASFTLTGQTTNLTSDRDIVAAQGSFTLTGQDATLTYGALTNYELTADQGSFVLTGQVSSVEYGYLVTAASSSFAITGQDTSFIKDGTISASQGSFVLTGQDANVEYGDVFAADQGSFSLMGQNIILGADRDIAADQATFSIADQDSNIEYGRAVVADQASYTLTGNDATLNFYSGKFIVCDMGSFIFTEGATSIKKSSDILYNIDAGEIRYNLGNGLIKDL